MPEGWRRQDGELLHDDMLLVASQVSVRDWQEWNIYPLKIAACSREALGHGDGVEKTNFINALAD